VKIYVASMEELGKKERQDETQFTIKIGGISNLGPSYFSFVNYSIPVPRLMPYYAETGCSRPLIALCSIIMRKLVVLVPYSEEFMDKSTDCKKLSKVPKIDITTS
jgi:hypothetical protein